MADEKFELSRRKALVGLGTVGAASAGAGFGTSAYFNDEESFENNSLTAGELDLKLDYKATYTGGPGRLNEIDSWYSDEGPGEPFDVEEIEDGTYLIGEVPDIEDDEIWEDEVRDTDLCDPELNLVNGDEIPVFTLEDVKPGDSGEVTVSLHICDNPAWMYMNGELTANDQNGTTEPEEAALMDEYGEIPNEGQLADAIETTLWYDENCNNVLDRGDEEAGEEVCVELVLDASGSMSGTRNTNTISGAQNLAESILTEGSEDNEVGVTFFSASGYDSDARIIQPLTGDEEDVDDAIGGLPASGGSTAIGNGIAAGRADLEGDVPDGEDWDDETGETIDGCDHDNKVMVVFTDGSNNAGMDPEIQADAAKADGIEIFAIGVGGAQTQTLEAIASEPTDEHVFQAADDEAIEQVFAQVAETITEGEEIIAEGSLAEVMDELEEGIALDGNRSSEEREPFMGGMTQCLGFEWELPDDVGNEVQTDSVEFDLGFYALQSRHVDDPPENPFNESFEDQNGLPS